MQANGAITPKSAGFNRGAVAMKIGTMTISGLLNKSLSNGKSAFMSRPPIIYTLEKTLAFNNLSPEIG